MANIPWKSPDPTEEALHAVQEALNPNPVESHTAQPATPAGPNEHAPQQETIDLFKAPARAGNVGRRIAAAARRQ